MRPAGRKRMPTIVTIFSKVVVTDIILNPYLHFVRQQDCLCYFSHGFAIVHTCLLYLAESFLFTKALFFHQNAFGALNYFACLQLVGKGASFFFESTKLVIASQSDFNRWRHLTFAKWFDNIIDNACFFGSFNQWLISKSRYERDRCDFFLCEGLC